MENAAPQTPTQSNQSVFAPSWEASEQAQQPQGQTQPQGSPQSSQSFEQAFTENADRIAQELELDTGNALPKAEPKQEPVASDKKQAKSAPNEWEKKYKQLESLSGTKLREAAAAKKRADEALAQAQRAIQVQEELQRVLAAGDPDLLLRSVGIDPAAYQQKAIEKAYAESQMTPEQREIARLKAVETENARLRQEHQQRIDAARKQQEAQQQEASTTQAAQNLSKAFMATAEQLKLPKSALTMQRFANMLSGARARGIDPTWSDLGKAVQAQYAEDVVGFLDNISPEEFSKFVPAKTQQKLRQIFLRQTGNAAAPTALASGPQAPSRKPQKFTGTADYNQFLEQLRRG